MFIDNLPCHTLKRLTEAYSTWKLTVNFLLTKVLVYDNIVLSNEREVLNYGLRKFKAGW